MLCPSEVRQYKQIRAIKLYSKSINISDLDKACLLWVSNGLALKWSIWYEENYK